MFDDGAKITGKRQQTSGDMKFNVEHTASRFLALENQLGRPTSSCRLEKSTAHAFWYNSCKAAGPVAGVIIMAKCATKLCQLQ